MEIKIKTGLKRKVAGLSLLEVIFRGRLARGDKQALAALRARLRRILERHDPDGVLLNLLAVDDMLIDDLSDVTSFVIEADRPRGSRLCSISVVMNTTLVNADGTPVHSFGMTGLLTCCSIRDYCLDLLVSYLAEKAARPKGHRPAYFLRDTLASHPWQDAHLNGWYSDHLWRMQEPPLIDLEAMPGYHGYRFLWLRTFDEPVGVRLEIDPEGKGVLAAKKTSGQGGYFPGRLVVDRSRKIPPSKVMAFLELLGKARFWEGEFVREDGLDGAEWIIEGVKDGRHKVVHVWSPREGAFRDAALYLLKLSRLRVRKIY